MLVSFLAVKLKWAQLSGLNWRLLFGISLLAGIGFTMSIFITNLAFTDESLIISSKISILVASLTAGILGLLVLIKANNLRNKYQLKWKSLLR